MMGTFIDLTVTAIKDPELILNEMTVLLEKYNLRFSANDATSELSEVNQQAGIKPVVVHRELYELIQIGKKHSLAKGSFLNIAIGPLVKAWRIGFKDATVPSKGTVRKLLALTNPKEIVLDEEKQTVFLTKKGMEIDLGALAKGYIADRLIAYLEKAGAQSALVNLGGNLVTYGPALKRPDLLWRIGIQNPVENRGHAQIVLKVPSISVVTSGIYERKLEKEEQVFHHIFNPSTGYPITTNIASITILSDLSVDGEVWTTRLFGHSKEAIIEAINKEPDIEGLVIMQNGEIAYSAGMFAYK